MGSRKWEVGSRGAWTAADWESAWAPCDEATYVDALALLRPDDVVLDIGAGDLRLARRMAQQCRQVIALERQAAVLVRAGSTPPPANLTAICADALTWPLPAGITTAVLLMRHCTHLAAYADRLRRAGCRHLITNARWRLGVELIELAAGVPWNSVAGGWYACRCGAVGFKPLPAAGLTAALLQQTAEVLDCPACRASD
ncbi:MAG: methyltransferase domain-containing protein [Anaerolineae bacterium]